MQEAAATGIDVVFRIFDTLNDVSQMRPAIEAVQDTGTAVAEVARCYTGDLSDPGETLYTLDYYLRLAERIVDAGAHELAINDPPARSWRRPDAHDPLAMVVLQRHLDRLDERNRQYSPAASTSDVPALGRLSSFQTPSPSPPRLYSIPFHHQPPMAPHSLPALTPSRLQFQRHACYEIR